MVYTIGEMAEKLKIASSTLRYYDAEGLLPFLDRKESGIRVFKDSDYEWLSIIECLKKTGMPIKEIKKFIDWCIEGDSTILNRKELIENQRQEVLQKIEQLQETLAILNYKKWYYETAEKLGSCKKVDALAKEEIPQELLEAMYKCKNMDE